MATDEKTLIGVLASHDSVEKNEALAQIIETCAKDRRLKKTLRKFRFVFTGGTYRRLFKGVPVYRTPRSKQSYKLTRRAKEFLEKDCDGVVILPDAEKGGVSMLSCLLTQRKVSILWPFLTPLTTHLYAPENQALLRLADYWRVKKLMNTGSVVEWIRSEAKRDANMNRQATPLVLNLPGSGTERAAIFRKGTWVLGAERDSFPDLKSAARRKDWSNVLVALISHDEMKGRMQDFVVDYERELGLFKGILATGTTGGLVQEAAPSLAEAKKVYRYHSGPKGGDIEIAIEILLGRCHIVFFFVDPLHPHPHADDIRVVFGACMLHDRVRMLSNEIQARSWMNRVVRG